MTKEEILQKHCPFKNVSGNTEYFTKEVIDAMEEYAQQQVKNLNIPAVIKSVCDNHGERIYNEETGIVYCSLCKKPV